MAPPGGGRNPVTARLLRHFHFIAFTEMEDETKVSSGINYDYNTATLLLIFIETIVRPFNFSRGIRLIY